MPTIEYEEIINWESTSAVYDNAQRMYNAASLVGKEGYYGVATSLMILSREEAQKCLLMAFVSSGFYDVSDESVKEELDECFRWHRYKIASSWLVNTFVSYLIELFMEEFRKKITSPEMIESTRKVTAERADNLRALAEKGTFLLDDLKKAGLYVGPNRMGEWSNPLQIPESVFSEVQSSTTFHLLIVKLACHIFHRNDLPEDWKLASQEFRRIIANTPADPSKLEALERTGQLGEILAGFWKFLRDNNLIEAYQSTHRLPKS